MDKEKGKGEGIIYPVRREKDPYVGPDVVMVMTAIDLRGLVESVGAERIPLPDMGLGRFYQTKGGEGEPLSFTGPYLGAPQAVMAMEKLIALGARRIWVLGWCGSLQPGLRIGHMVIPLQAVSEEGTSRHYPIGRRRIESEAELNRLLEQALLQRGLPFERGTVWTTDAPYRETQEKVRDYQRRGILAVEMEMSALMTLAIYRAVSMTGLLVVSDELFDLKWRPGFSDPSLTEASRTAGEVILGLVRRFQ